MDGGLPYTSIKISLFVMLFNVTVNIRGDCFLRNDDELGWIDLIDLIEKE